jgi:hypothetical protein
MRTNRIRAKGVIKYEILNIGSTTHALRLARRRRRRHGYSCRALGINRSESGTNGEIDRSL